MHKTLILALLAATALSASAHADDTTAWRLFVGDHTALQVTALDLVSGASLATFPLATDRSGSPDRIRRRARSTRREITYWCGDMPNSRPNERTR